MEIRYGLFSGRLCRLCLSLMSTVIARPLGERLAGVVYGGLRWVLVLAFVWGLIYHPVHLLTETHVVGAGVGFAQGSVLGEWGDGVDSGGHAPHWAADHQFHMVVSSVGVGIDGQWDELSGCVYVEGVRREGEGVGFFEGVDGWVVTFDWVGLGGSRGPPVV
ncbi:MAG: hypothetical protein RI897_2106 [Verrucomicrobiota bacterium]|jgi:hypothetical protein